MYSRIALVDAGYLTVRNYKAKASDAKLTPAQVAEYTISNVMAELAATRDAVEHVILCCDAPPYWRAKEYPDYKGTRPEPDPELAVIKRGIFDRIKADGYTIARVDTFEADDLIATLAKEYSKRCPDVRIVGADKDAMQCVTDRVRVFVPKVGKRPEEIMGPAEVRKKFGVMPEAMALYQALVGDTGDNIPGVEKVGAKTAAEWINTYGNSIMKLGIQLAAEADKGDKMAKTWINFGEAYPRMKFWLRMTTLRTDVPIDAAALLVKLDAKPLVEVDDEPDNMGLEEEDFDIQASSSFPPDPDELAEEAAVMAANDDNGQRLANELAKPVDTAKEFAAGEAARKTNGAGASPEGVNQPVAAPAPAPADKPKVTDAAALERAIAKANTVPAAKGKKAEPTDAEIDATQASIAEHNAKERARAEFRAKLERDRAADEATAKAQRAATRAPLPDPKAGEVMASVAKEFNESRQVAPKVTDAEFTEQPKPKPAKPTPEERITSGEFDAKAQTVALARVPHSEQEFRLSLQPRTLSEAVTLSRVLLNSRRFPQFGSMNEGGILSIIATGRELGLTFMQSLNGIHDIKGKPFTGWQLIKYLAEKHPDCEWLMCAEANDQKAVWRTKHRVHGILEYPYTIERAHKAGLFRQNKENWEGKPQEMLTKTALSKGCWQWYTSALVGLPLQDETEAPAEEMGDAASV